jgi:hypothetical protein
MTSLAVLIETSSASLDTLAVTIKALHVSGKQMTLAVFRQLPAEKVEEGDGLWGVVRYAIKDEGDLWCVFSRNGRLYRHSMNLRRRRYSPDWRTLEHEKNTANRLAEAHERQRRSDPIWAANNPNYLLDIKENIRACELLYNKARASADEQRAIAKSDQDEEDARHARDTELAELPQLFIAV